MTDILDAALKHRAGALEIDVALRVGPGPFVLAGPSGSGKTSVLRLLLGVTRPSEGHVRLGEVTLFDSENGIDVPTEARRLGYLPQHYGLFPHLSAIENVRFALDSHPGLGRRADRRAAALDALRQLDVAHVADRRPDMLSGGERQRVALARALASRPRALLLDEPLTALDVTARKSVRAFLASHLRALRIPAIVVTHDPEDAAALDAPVAILEAGRITQQGTLAAIAGAPATSFVRDFTAPLRSTSA